MIVVDNDSNDDTGYTVASEFPWVQLIVNRTNAGFARAINEGIRFAKGEYLLLLNPDTVVSPGTLGRVVSELSVGPMWECSAASSSAPTGASTTPASVAFRPCFRLCTTSPGSPAGSPTVRASPSTRRPISGVDETGPVDAINGAFMLVRREAAEEVGDLDERYWLWAEDLDWCHRFWGRGWKVLYWPEVEVVHLKGASVGEHRSLRLNFAFHRSIWLFYKKHHAPHRSPLLTALVAVGVWSKFLASVVGNTARGLRSPRAST